MITSDDIKALKKCDQIRITWRQDADVPSWEQSATVTCIRKAKEPLERDIEYRFTVRASPGERMSWKSTQRFRVISLDYWSDCFRTAQATLYNSIVAMLRKGDDVTLDLEVSASERNEEMGVVTDVIDIRIRRGGKSYRFRFDDWTIEARSQIRWLKETPLA